MTVVKHKDEQTVSLGTYADSYCDTISFDSLNSLPSISDITLSYAVYNAACERSHDPQQNKCVNANNAR